MIGFKDYMNNALITADFNRLPLRAGSEEQYIQAVNAIPALDAETEQDLAFRYVEHDDLEAARWLVLAHLRFVVHVARGYNGYGLPLADLIQEGNVGLMKAVKRFDPAVGVRLVSFAVHWIRSEIHDFILRNWRIVKVATTKAQRKLFFNLRSAKKRLGWLNRQEVEAVAADLGVKPEVVTEMESRLAAQDVEFDPGPESDIEEHHATAPAQYLRADNADPAGSIEQTDWDSAREQSLERAMEELDARSRDIVVRRWLDEPKATLQSLADEYGVSAERIRQLEKQGIKLLKAQLESA